MYFIDADGIVSRPFPVVQALAQGKRSLVKGSSNGQSKPRVVGFSVTSVSSVVKIKKLNHGGHGGNPEGGLYAVEALLSKLRSILTLGQRVRVSVETNR
jgi:hypothetical protein